MEGADRVVCPERGLNLPSLYARGRTGGGEFIEFPAINYSGTVTQQKIGTGVYGTSPVYNPAVNEVA